MSIFVIGHQRIILTGVLPIKCIISYIQVPGFELQKINIQFCVEQFHILPYRLALLRQTE